MRCVFEVMRCILLTIRVVRRLVIKENYLGYIPDGTLLIEQVRSAQNKARYVIFKASRIYSGMPDGTSGQVL